MNKKMKGLLAGAAGLALLLGAGGTFALWNDETRLFNATEDNLRTGHLHLGIDGSSATYSIPWQYRLGTTAEFVPIPTDFRPIPGHTVRGLIAPSDGQLVHAVGTDLTWALSLDGILVGTGDTTVTPDVFNTVPTSLISALGGNFVLTDYWDISIVVAANGITLQAQFIPAATASGPGSWTPNRGVATSNDQSTDIFNITTANWNLELVQTLS